jgi:hypothetical protein
MVLSSVVIATSYPHPSSPKFDTKNSYANKNPGIEFGGGAEGGGGGLKQKLARTRGENLIHAVPPDLPSYEGIS